MKRKLFVILAALMLAVTFMPAVASATYVTLEPSTLNVAPGAPVNVSVNMYESSGFTMTAISEIINYDPAVFTYVDPVVQGAFLTPVWDLQAAATIPGELRIASFSGGSVPVGDGTLFSFTLLANAGAPLGSSALSWGNGSFLGDGFGYGDTEWNDVLLPSSGASINVSAVPIPAAVWLLGTGLVGLFGIRRRFTS
jgi:hypothetical protein